MQNIYDFLYDLLVLSMCLLNIIGPWRYSLLYRRYQAKTLERRDLLLNPFLSLCDLPWLVLTILFFVLMPWRIYSFYRLSKFHAHFPEDKMGVIKYDMSTLCLVYGVVDYFHLPFILIGSLNPSHFLIMLNLFKFDMKYQFLMEDKNRGSFQKCESYRRKVVRFYCSKLIYDLCFYFLLFSVNMLTIYYIPLFRFMLKNKQKFYPDWDHDKLKKQVELDTYQAFSHFELITSLQDCYQPQDVRAAITIVNKQFLTTLPYFPLMALTLIFNPYRTYQFFIASDHEFVNFSTASPKHLKEQEEQKRVDTTLKFKESLTDLLALLSTLLIGVTLLRALYLISILSVNGHLTRFNPFLKRVSKSTILLIKLQQIETIMKDEEKLKAKRKDYLSVKYCIWLSVVELLLDILILPFICAFFVLIPWRLNKLFAIAVSQYERVPTKKIKKGHYTREYSEHHQNPKRVQAIETLFRFLILDFLVLLMSAILIVTLWRSLETLEILNNFFQRRFSKDQHKVEFIDSVLKDKPLVKCIAKQFQYLMTDLSYLFMFSFTVICYFRAQSVVSRLKQIFEKKKLRDEVHALNLVKKIKLMAQFKEEVKDVKEEERQKELLKKKRIVDLNKNTMSLLLPYLKQDEILNMERTTKKMYIFTNFWPVWKNIYSDQHKKDSRIPELVSQMTPEESEKLDYRSACKRCFIYTKNNFQEEILPELVDYFKGYKLVIIEEFINTLILLPTALLFPIRGLGAVLDLVYKAMFFGYRKIDPYMQIIGISKTCVFLTMFPHGTPFDQYDQSLPELLADPHRKHFYLLFCSIVKIYVMIQNVSCFLIIRSVLFIVQVVSAGPICNLRSGHPPPPLTEYPFVIAVPLYFVQFFLMFPAILGFWFLPLFGFYLAGLRIFSSHRYWYSTEQFIAVYVAFCIDIFTLQLSPALDKYVSHQKMPYIQPFEVFCILGRAIKYLVNNLIVKPGKAAGKGLISVLKIVTDYLASIFKALYSAVKVVIDKIAYFLYTILKMLMESLLKGATVSYNYLLLPAKGLNAGYFAIFKFLLISLRALGIVGELIFTIYGVLWLAWPLAVAYWLGNVGFYIPGVILTIILIVQGRKVIVSNQ